MKKGMRNERGRREEKAEGGREGGGRERERANLAPSRHFVLWECSWEIFSLHQLLPLPSDNAVLFF